MADQGAGAFSREMTRISQILHQTSNNTRTVHRLACLAAPQAHQAILEEAARQQHFAVGILNRAVNRGWRDQLALCRQNLAPGGQRGTYGSSPQAQAGKGRVAKAARNLAKSHRDSQGCLIPICAICGISLENPDRRHFFAADEADARNSISRSLQEMLPGTSDPVSAASVTGNGSAAVHLAGSSYGQVLHDLVGNRYADPVRASQQPDAGHRFCSAHAGVAHYLRCLRHLRLITVSDSGPAPVPPATIFILRVATKWHG